MITGVQYIALEWALVVLTLLCVILRQYLLYLRHNRFTWGDLFVALAWVFFIAQTCMDTALLYLGMFDGRVAPGSEEYGPKVGLATYSETVSALKLVYVETSIYYSEMYCVKWAMLSFYHELFPTNLKKLRIALTVTTWFTVVAWAVSLLVKLFVCEPISTNWDPNDYCNTNASFISNSTEWALHCATDVVIYVLPLFLLRKLQLPLLQKVGVGLTFSMGFICIAFANMFQISILVGDLPPQIWLYSALEQSWALIVVCCPSFKQLLSRKGFKRALQGRLGSGSNESNGNSRYGNGSRTGKSNNSQTGRDTLGSGGRFSRHPSKSGTTIFVTQSNGSISPEPTIEHDQRDVEMHRLSQGQHKHGQSMGEGITVSYEMERHTEVEPHAVSGSTEKIAPNVSASAWSAV